MTKLREISVQRDTFVKAPIERVWAALTDPSLYPTWGPVAVHGVLAPGEVPVLDFGQAGGGKAAVHVVAVEAPRYFAYHWAQGATDPAVLLADPRETVHTLVEFRLEVESEGTRVRVTESGAVDPEKFTDAMLAGMGQGWQLMLGGLPRYFGAADLPIGDRLEVVLEMAAPPAAVFDALVNPTRWWAQAITGELEPGAEAVLDFGPFGKQCFAVVAREAPTRFAFRHVAGTEDPAALAASPAGQPSTLVEIALAPTEAGGTRVQLVESGFEGLGVEPLAPHVHRANAAWGIILGLLEMHVTK